MKPAFVSAFLCLITGAPVQAADLLQIYDMARQNDAEFRAQTASYYADQQFSAQSRAALLPQISGQVSQSQDDSKLESGNTPFGSGGSETFSYAVTLSQSLYDHGYWQRLGKANIQVAQSEANYNAARQSLILRVAETYFDVLAAQDNLKFAEAETRAVGQQLEQARQRFDVGLIAITDVKESQAEYDQAVAAEIAARNRLDASREALWTLTNTDVEFLAGLGSELPLTPPEPADKQQWVDRAVENNLELQSAALARDAAYKEISIQRSGHLPSLGLTAQRRFSDVQYDDTSINNGLGRETTDTSIAVQLSIPIFSGGATHARVKEAVHRHDAARDQFELTRRRVVQQTRDAYQNTLADISRVNALKQALLSAQAAYQATEAGFEVGTRNSVDVLISLRNTFRAERDYAQTRYDYLLDTLRLKQAVGDLQQADIDALNRHLD